MSLSRKLRKQTYLKKYYDAAVTHANTTIKNHLREDFSCYHVVDYDSITGEIRDKATAQGYADNSAWGRGQAWGIYGFTMVYREMEKLQDPNAFVEACVKELAARLLRLVIKRTPVGDYSGQSYTCETGFSHKGKKVKGKQGGTLRRGWTAGQRASAKGYADSLTVNHFGGTYVIEIVNPVEYASYVEYGHRTANHKGWVKGHFMMKISEQELQNMAPQILERKIRKYLGDIMK